MKDYIKADSEKPKYLYRIVDKETLVGNEKRVYGQDPTTDERIGAETGLYELYMNVVKRFNDKMIEEAERFAGTAHSGVSSEVLPNAEWIARGGTTIHGPGMSYSFGGKQSISQFNKDPGGGFVRGCSAGKSEMEPKPKLVISENGVSQGMCNTCHYSTSTDKKFRLMNVVKNAPVDSSYRGNVRSNSCGQVGEQKYPGLYKDEFYSKDGYLTYDIVNQSVNGQTIAMPQFDSTYWAGSDCSNLVQRSIVAAKRHNIQDVVVKLDVNSNDNLSTQIPSGGFCAIPEDGQTIAPIDHAFGIPLSGNNKENAKKLRRGDIITYDGHVSIMHSEAPSCKGTGKGATCAYEIISAYGGTGDTEYYIYPNIPEAGINRGKSVFGRKVIKTWQNIGSTTGFGRIKLWD